MVDDYLLDKALDRIKEIIGTEKFGDTRILVDPDEKLPGDCCFKKGRDFNNMHYLKNRMHYVKNPQVFSEKALFLK